MPLSTLVKSPSQSVSAEPAACLPLDAVDGFVTRRYRAAMPRRVRNPDVGTDRTAGVGFTAVPGRTGWRVYMVRCRDGSLYTGITNDLAKRLRAHNAGTASRYTRSRRPVALVYQQVRRTKGTALRREAAIKKLSRTQKEQLIDGVS